MSLKNKILSRVTKNNSNWVEQLNYDIENREEIRAINFIVLTIKQYMKEHGLKQNELAEILGVTPQYVNKLLHGQVRNIGIGTLLKYGNKLGLKLVEVPGLEEKSEQKEQLETRVIKLSYEVRTDINYVASRNFNSLNLKYNKYSYGTSKFN